jgi:hypothetical protein
MAEEGRMEGSRKNGGRRQELRQVGDRKKEWQKKAGTDAVGG